MARTAAKLLVAYRGKRLTWELGGIEIDVRCHDAQVAYGRERLLIEPVAGRGTKWVGAEAIRESRRDEQAASGGGDQGAGPQARAEGD